jgi:hypothetical protein
LSVWKAGFLTAEGRGGRLRINLKFNISNLQSKSSNLKFVLSNSNIFFPLRPLRLNPYSQFQSTQAKTMPGGSMFQKAFGMSALIRLVLLNLREHPVEFAGSHLAVTIFADARDIDLERSAAVRAVKVCAGAGGRRVAVAYEGPVFAPSSQLLI